MAKTKGAVDHIPTPDKQELVKRLIIGGISRYMIANILKISEDTLHKHYSELMDRAEPEVIAQVAKSLVEQALQGNPTAQIFYLKTRAKWRDESKLEITGADNAPLIPVLNVTLNTKG